jgi:TonB-dependent Receptor Plug Domain
VVKYVGYEDLKESVLVESNKIVSKKLYIEKKTVNIKEVEISAEKQEAQKTVKMSVTKITPKDIKLIPTVGGTADLAQYLQVLPGVIFTGDQGGQLYIRGGSPIQNKVLLDGMIIYNPFHSIGLFSVFETDIIRNADVYTGGFGAEFGGRISSIMDITTKDGNKKEYSGKLAATTFGASALLEGPVIREKKIGGSSSSFILSAKSSYLEQSSKLFYQYVSENGLPFNYTDLYGKISFNGNNGSKFNLFGFNYTDNVQYLAQSDLNWTQRGVGGDFILVPSSSSTLVGGHFSNSGYKIKLEEDAVSPRTSSINGFNLGFDFKVFKGDNEIKYGIEVVGFGTNFEFENEFRRKIIQKESTTELSGYVSYRVNLGFLVLEPGLRAQYYSTLSVFSPEPRLAVKYNITEKLRAKAAAGMYSQNLIAANSDRDVVNLFYGFLAGPDNLQDNFVDENGKSSAVKNPLQKSNHLIFGFEYDFNKYLNVNIEGYYKRFGQLSNINRNKIYEDGDTDKPETQRKDFIIETGDAKGIDLVVKYSKDRYYFWAVYSLGDVDRWDGFITYDPVFDRRHNVNLVASYSFGKDKQYEVNARWNYGSGFPFTQTQGYYQSEDFSEGINTPIQTENSNQVEIQYAGLNKGKLPDYHRMDFNLKRIFKFSKMSTLEANLGVTNIYNRENIFYVNRITQDRVNQLPILPSLGVNFTF